jgi:hypothetical protein
MRYRILVFFIIVAAFMIGVFSGPQTHAQQFELYSEADIFAETTPNLPGPNQQVTLKLNSYSFNLNNYQISWFENGSRQGSGFGNREYSFTTGNPGEVTNITALIEVGNQTFRKEFRFTPSQVDILWEAPNSYTPPFYRGKALPLQQAEIKFTAIPETQLINPKNAPNLVYYWDKNDRRDATASGFGKQSYTTTADPLNFEEIITVTVNDRGENSFAKQSIQIPVVDHEPRILFYEIDANNRLLTHKELSTNNTTNKEQIALSFHPLHMSTTENNFTDMFVAWNINNEVVPPQDFEEQNRLFISSGGETGSARIGVSLEHISKILQEHTQTFNLNFTQ